MMKAGRPAERRASIGDQAMWAGSENDRERQRRGERDQRIADYQRQWVGSARVPDVLRGQAGMIGPKNVQPQQDVLPPCEKA